MKISLKPLPILSLILGALMLGSILTESSYAARMNLTAQEQKEIKEKRKTNRAAKKAMKNEMRAYRVSLEGSKMSEADKTKAIKNKRAELRKKHFKDAK